MLRMKRRIGSRGFVIGRTILELHCLTHIGPEIFRDLRSHINPGVNGESFPIIFVASSRDRAPGNTFHRVIHCSSICSRPSILLLSDKTSKTRRRSIVSIVSITAAAPAGRHYWKDYRSWFLCNIFVLSV